MGRSASNAPGRKRTYNVRERRVERAGELTRRWIKLVMPAWAPRSKISSTLYWSKHSLHT